MTAEELLRRYAAGERDFVGIKLKNIDLRSIDLSGSNFTNARITNVIFNGVNLSKAILIGTQIDSTNFILNTIEGANLSQSDMFGVFIEKTNLKRCKIEGSSFIECTFEKVDMEEAIVRNNLWGDTTRLIGTNLRGAIWEEIDGYPLRRDTIMPNEDIITDMIELPDGSKIVS